MELSLELLKALQDCVETINKLTNLLEEDREDMPNCINGEILREYLRGAESAKESLAALLADLRGILECC